MNKKESKYFSTAERMRDALVILLEKRDFEYITVKDICKEANVNRSTFYLHYENLNDLLDELLVCTTREFDEDFKDIRKPDVVLDCKNDLFFITEQYLLPYLTYIKKNKRIYQASKRNPRLFGADVMSNDVYKHVISKVLDRFGVDESHKEYMFRFYISGLNSIVLAWCSNDCDLEISEVVKLIMKLIKMDE